MDTITEFIQKLENEIEGLPPGSLLPQTRYRELPVWSSMYALILIALSETEYNVTITGEDLRKCESILDLYNLISNRT